MTIPNGRRHKFVIEYLKDLNATQAAIRAGYSEKGARVQGVRLLTDDNIQALIQKARTKDADNAGITRERVLQEYYRIAFGDVVTVLSWTQAGVVLKASEELPADVTAMIAEISETVNKEGGTVKVKLHDKLRALEGIKKMLGYDAPTKTALTDPDGAPVNIIFEMVTKKEEPDHE